MEKNFLREKSLVPDCNTLAYRKVKKNTIVGHFTKVEQFNFSQKKIHFVFTENRKNVRPGF